MRNLIFGDWGTTNLRLYLAIDGEIRGVINGSGVKGLEINPKDYLISLCQNWLDSEKISEIVLCGMAGSKLGIIEAPYQSVPLRAADFFSNFVKLNAQVAHKKNITISILGGVKGNNFTQKLDVMRGEETLVYGASEILGEGGKLCILPGTHSKWVQVENNKIINFQTFPSGELFDILSNNSTLCSPNSGFDISGFLVGIETVQKDNSFLASLFGARSNQLLNSKSSDWANGFLSGLIIAREIFECQSISKTYSEIFLIGGNSLSEKYKLALEKFGMNCTIIDAEKCAINGLLAFSKQEK